MTIARVKVKGKQTIVTIDLDKFQKVVKEKCEVQNRQAVRAWLSEVVKHIPGYTGTARGTLVPVGRLVNRVVQKYRPGDPLGDPVNAKKKKHIYIGGRKLPAGFGAGASYASASINTSVDGSTITNTFTFDQGLFYVIYNDMFSAPPNFILPSNPPWHSHDKAALAWKKYITQVAIKRLPVPRDFVKITVLQVR